jgi:S-adenosylmethionine decarboxylase
MVARECGRSFGMVKQVLLKQVLLKQVLLKQVLLKLFLFLSVLEAQWCSAHSVYSLLHVPWVLAQLVEQHYSNDSEVKKVGSHRLVEFVGCSSYPDRFELEHLLWYAAYASHGTILTVKIHEFGPQAYTGFVLLSESHISLHSWPEYGYVAIDFFSCGAEMDMSRGIELLRLHFQPEAVYSFEVERGYLSS